MNDQSSTTSVQVNKNSNSRPVLVTIIAVLMIIAGIVPVLGIWSAFTLISLSHGSSGSDAILAMILSIWAVISGAITIIIGIGFLKMKKWALYIQTALVVITLIQVILTVVLKHQTSMATWAGFAIEVIVMAYLWSIQKQFN